ncbi:MAG: hypothetical protein Q9187_001781 [Circinaria calcarea]
MPPTTKSKAAKASSSTSPPEVSIRESSNTGSSPFASNPRQPTRQLPAPSSRKAKEPSYLASALSEKSARVLPDNAIVHWPCRSCSCPQGVFTPPIDLCMFCEHDMSEHELPFSNMAWNPECSYISQREELVAATIRLVLEKGVLVIRATPQVGKSTLLILLGRHILAEYPSLEPIWIQWESAEKRNGLPYQDYLDEKAKHWRKINAKYRDHNPNAKLIYLIDEAQNSYLEPDFWSRQLKNMFTRSRSLYILVCVYGSTTELLAGPNENIQSEAIRIDQSQRIGLFPSVTGGLCMQFTSKETEDVVQKWAFDNKYKLMGSVCEYMHIATSGHPGMIGLLLGHFESRFPQLNSKVRFSKTWTPELCHAIIADQAGFMAELGRYGRGVWTEWAEKSCQNTLLTKDYGDIKFSDIFRVMLHTAMKRDGCTHLQTGFDAFAFCHKMGFLHTEPSAGLDQRKITYVFASPIHRRVAHMRLLPGPDPDAAPDGRTLLQVCLNAIEGISPSAIQSRSSNRWSIPEAAFQDEIYRCLHRELNHLPILSEYAHSSNGGVDFYIFDKKWGVEILQSGSKAQIMEHAARFGPEGKYRTWNILDDYIVLSFCPKPKLRNLEIQDSELQSHIMQIAIDPHERTAEIYTYDMQLKATFMLGEGRYGSSTGVPNLGMGTGESNALVSDENGLLAAALYKRDREETCRLIELLKSSGTVFDEAALLRMSKEEKEGVLKLFGVY